MISSSGSHKAPCEPHPLRGLEHRRGRVDILVSHGSHRFVCEVKREERDVTRDGVSRYLGQKAQYQATDVALGMVLVLDLTERDFDRHIESRIWVERVHQEGDVERAIVVALVAGNRQSPSALSRSQWRALAPFATCGR